MTLEGLNRAMTAALSQSLGAREGRAVARLLLEDVIGASTTDLLVHGDRTLEPETVQHINSMVARIAAGEPAQYVVGRARFMGMDLEVNRFTLIPRPETAGLVDLVCDDYRGRSDLSLLDVGTGSGCIAIALARALPFARVEAVDISQGALDTATANARRLGVKIDFHLCDILSTTADDLSHYDFIVSNPPYIKRSESADMEAHVVDYEPDTALFVSDDDPLVFYRAIARLGRETLNDGGRLYFEINPLTADNLATMLADEGYTDIDILPDYLGRKRFARCTIQR